MAKRFDITPPTVFQWRSGHRNVPWEKLKYVVDMQNVSWDWLLDGRGPKRRGSGPVGPLPEFDWEGMNERFLSLFLGMPQREMAELLDVTQGAISLWKTNRRHIPWDKLKWVVDSRHVTWEWLVEGREPEYRDA